MHNRSLKDFLVGALVGIMSMLPGASGGTIAVIFGMYERLIADIANIRTRLLKDLHFIIPVGLGILAGLVVCAFGLSAIVKNWETPAMFFFVALIVCQIPDIYRLGEGDGDADTTGYNILAAIVGFALMVAILFLGTIETTSSFDFTDMDLMAVLLLALVGAVIAVSKIVPGVSGSSILLALGLYTPLLALFDLETFNFTDLVVVAIPILAGLGIAVLALSKVVDHCMRNHRRSTYFAILGLTVGSVVTVSVDASSGLTDTMNIAGSILGMVLGLAFGYMLSRFSSKYAEETLHAEQ